LSDGWYAWALLSDHNGPPSSKETEYPLCRRKTSQQIIKDNIVTIARMPALRKWFGCIYVGFSIKRQADRIEPSFQSTRSIISE